MKHCVYVTSGWGVHDDRWVDALRRQDYEPTIIRLGIDGNDTKEFRERVSLVAGPEIPVLAGPLSTVTKSLIGINAPLVGLSWGFDLHELDDFNWLPQLDGLIVDSVATASIAQGVGVAADRMTLLPWGIDQKVFHPDGERADLTALGISEESIVFLSLRAHEPRYHISQILEAFESAARNHPTTHLVVGHSGSLTDTLRRQAAQMTCSDRIYFVGTVAESELPKFFRAADAYITASEVDGTSVTLLQAMGCGTPVIASDTVGNLAWVSNGKSGLTFSTGVTQSLATQISTFLANSDEARASLALNARLEVLQQADWATNLDRLGIALRAAHRHGNS